MNIPEFLTQPILKKHLQTAAFYFFQWFTLHGPKCLLKSRLYDSFRLEGPSHRSSFCFEVSISHSEVSPTLHLKT